MSSFPFTAIREQLHGAFNNNLGLTNPYDPSFDYGPADFDVRHRFVGSVIWTVPFAKEVTGFTKALLDGWTLTGIFNARTGTPFTIFDGTRTSRVRDWSQMDR